jgi:hypothetical protein
VNDYVDYFPMATSNSFGVGNTIPLTAHTQYVFLLLFLLSILMSLLVSFARYISLVILMFYVVNFWIKFSRLLPLIPIQQLLWVAD